MISAQSFAVHTVLQASKIQLHTSIIMSNNPQTHGEPYPQQNDLPPPYTLADQPPTYSENEGAQWEDVLPIRTARCSNPLPQITNPSPANPFALPTAPAPIHIPASTLPTSYTAVPERATAVRRTPTRRTLGKGCDVCGSVMALLVFGGLVGMGIWMTVVTESHESGEVGI
jgi:hypothetical protein